MIDVISFHYVILIKEFNIYYFFIKIFKINWYSFYTYAVRIKNILGNDIYVVFILQILRNRIQVFDYISEN